MSSLEIEQVTQIFVKQGWLTSQFLEILKSSNLDQVLRYQPKSFIWQLSVILCHSIMYFWGPLLSKESEAPRVGLRASILGIDLAFSIAASISFGL